MTVAAPAVVWERFVDDEGDDVDEYDEQARPAHDGAYLVPPCCTTGDPDAGGLITCGCGGRWSVECPAADCPGITDDEADEIRERLQS